MVDTLNHCWLAALTNSMASSPVAEKLMRIKRQNRPPARPMESGLDLEKQISTPVEAELLS